MIAFETVPIVIFLVRTSIQSNQIVFLTVYHRYNYTIHRYMLVKV
jgi:hypothetical protein